MRTQRNHDDRRAGRREPFGLYDQGEGDRRDAGWIVIVFLHDDSVSGSAGLRIDCDAREHRRLERHRRHEQPGCGRHLGRGIEQRAGQRSSGVQQPGWNGSLVEQVTSALERGRPSPVARSPHAAEVPQA